MKYYIVIPSHNEETLISLTLQSLVEQTVLPTRIVVVNDNSTDNTKAIVTAFVSKYPFIPGFLKSGPKGSPSGAAV